MNRPTSLEGSDGSRRALVLGALGVVYGDIGTSPLYTVKQCFDSIGSLSPMVIYGVLSLIAWALMIVVTAKYVIVIMRSDNRGEGGILALTALALRTASRTGRRHRWILCAGLIGAALFYGDGVITPAISVLSAVEGLKIVTPVFVPYIVPITIGLLLALFLFQSHGTALVGGLFGPIMAVWFLVIGVLGAIEIAKAPSILWAFNPYYGLELLIDAPWPGFILLGAVVLAVTGAEALYADMGHFGRSPIRVAWLRFVFPALMLNYFGQGALLLATPDALESPFYRLAPDWALLPLVMLAAAATIIASQAVITGAFSMTNQAVQLGYLPRLSILHTSEKTVGQIYVPAVNLCLLVAVVGLVLGFKSSDNLGSAYGIAVTGTMSLTTMLSFVYTISVLKWNRLLSVLLFGFFLVVDLAFFTSNMMKIEQGGWVPLGIAVVVFTMMWAWISGRKSIAREHARSSVPLTLFLSGSAPLTCRRVPGTAVFMTSDVDSVPTALLHNLKHNKALHERVVLMNVRTEDVPHVLADHRIEVTALAHNFFIVKLDYGFMDEPNIPLALKACKTGDTPFHPLETSYFLGNEKMMVARCSPFTRWGRHIFIAMANTTLNATEYFRIPVNRVIELGGQIEI